MARYGNGKAESGPLRSTAAAPAARPDAEPSIRGLLAYHPEEGISALDVALARQEYLAAVNASNPMAKHILVRLAASIVRQARGQ